MKVGLALGGGAARGLSHIGVLQAFEEHGLPVDVLAGTSIGAMVGALYALTGDSRQVRERIESYLASEVFRKARLDFLKERNEEEGDGIFYRFSSFVRKSIFYTISLTKPSFISQETLDRNLNFLFPDVMIEDLPLPFAAVAADIVSGTTHVFTTGSLRQAVAASCALPGIIPPVVLGEEVLVDGGWLDAVPVGPARELGADLVVGVDVCGDVSPAEDLKSGLDVVFRADQVSRYALARRMVSAADVLIPPGVCSMHWADFSQVDALIGEGHRSATLRIGDIRRALRKKRFLGLARGFLPI